jgi:hypothetical protein
MLSKQLNNKNIQPQIIKSQNNIQTQTNITPQNKFYNLVNPILQTKKINYSLDQHFFDPTQNSPPNNFLLKIHQRINKS